jgi:signal transduction histidine kinase
MLTSFADDLEVRFLFEQLAQSAPHDLVVIEEEHAGHDAILPPRASRRNAYARNVAIEHAGPRSLRQLLDAVLAVGSDLDLASVLTRIVESAVSLVDARYGALGVLDDAGTGLGQFITVGIDDETRAAIGPPPKGLGILGLLIADARPLRLADIAEHTGSAGFPPNHPPMRTFLGVPVRIGSRVFGNLYLTDKTTGEVFTDVDEELVLGLAAAAGIAINNADLFEEVRRAERERAGLQEIATALLAGTDTQTILEVVAARAREIVDADLATIALPTPGTDQMSIQVAIGKQSDAVLGRSFGASGTITGEVFETAEPVTLNDLSTDRRRTQPQVELGTIGPAVFVPLGAAGNVLGSLAVSRAVGSDPFRAGDVAVLRQFATQASVVIEQGRARDELHRLSLLENQERIARDLHDTVIQRLFATGLSLQGVSRLIREDEPRRRVEAAVDELDTTVRHIRTVIFDVESTRGAEGSLRRRVLEVTREASRPLGFTPHTTFDGLVDAEIGGPLGDDLIATLREALSNVARHAHATRVEVDVRAAAATAELRVRDDGVGLSASASPGYGLQNMRTRAEQHGGQCSISGSASGTVVEWTVPLTSAQ